MNKLIILILTFILSIPIVLADSVFDNPAFDVVLIIIFSAVIFFFVRRAISMIK